MTQPTASEDVAYDYELKFDESEIGGGSFAYFGLVTDIDTPADILVRMKTRGDHDENYAAAKSLAQEVVKRWNAYTPSVAESPKVTHSHPENVFKVVNSTHVHGELKELIVETGGNTVRFVPESPKVDVWEKTVWEIYSQIENSGQCAAVSARKIIEKNHPDHFEE